MTKKSEFYSKLKLQLEDTTSFPTDYLYKFIVPSLEDQVAQVTAIFNNTGAVIKTKKSKTGKYVSVSVLLKLKTADEVISYYKKAETVKGIISL